MSLLRRILGNIFESPSAKKGSYAKEMQGSAIRLRMAQRLYPGLWLKNEIFNPESSSPKLES